MGIKDEHQSPRNWAVFFLSAHLPPSPTVGAPEEISKWNFHEARHFFLLEVPRRGLSVLKMLEMPCESSK